jgi:pyridoxal phosphate enzyme (YggS family)
MELASDLAANLAAVRARLARAARRAGRDPGDVLLCAVSKTQPPAAIRAAHAAGQRCFAENYAQELRDKAAELGDLADLTWHFIGPLQRNKVKYVVGTAALVQSVDSVRLLEELGRRAAQAGAPLPCLVEVNIAGEATKSGVAPAELPALLDAFAAQPALSCLGLMTMPPFADDPEAARPHFRALRALRDREAARPRPRVDLRHLSMGMSQDFEVAIEEGATIVRVGTAIFGARSYPA